MVSDRVLPCRWWMEARVLILVLMEYGLWPVYGSRKGFGWIVLILVLMEYGLWRRVNLIWKEYGKVLILVLMEYGLWPIKRRPIGSVVFVLILVLMEYGLWLDEVVTRSLFRSLNPCSNGIWSLTQIGSRWLCRSIVGLNPCSNGIWSLTQVSQNLTIAQLTGLNPCSNGIWSLTRGESDSARPSAWVLILVLMEYGLWRRPSEPEQARQAWS